MERSEQRLADSYERAIDLGGRLLSLLEDAVNDDMVETVAHLVEERGRAVTEAAELLEGRGPERAAKQLLEQLLRQQQLLEGGLAGSLTALKRLVDSSQVRRDNMEGVSRLLASRTHSRLVNEVR